MTTDLQEEREALELFRALLDDDDLSEAQIQMRLSQSDPLVARRVLAMLARHLSSTGRLERPWRESVRAASAPERLGPFSLGEEIGRGGMGVVALGERVDEGFVQRVAIKWMPGGHLGSSRRARFLFERDVVVRLRHPHIAQLIDGGEGPRGELWYAMEFIAGTDLPTHCRDHRLALRTRVELLADLCDAVSHAHRHSILHRDIKPSNVLVTPEGQLKLIDFGIAKSLDGTLENETQDAMPMTPRYASPEQLRGERPTTASDQWQLGALAFEVLTGERLREGDPRSTLPSSRVARLEDAAAVAFSTDRKSLIRSLKGDMDAIITKALADGPERRYGSVDEMARELRDWLAGRPLASRRSETWYATGRFISDHRWAIAFATVAVVTLIAATVFSLVMANRAKEEARVAARTSDLMSRMFLSTRDGRTIVSMTMAEFFSQAIETASEDSELPFINRYRLLRDLAPRAMEVGSRDAAEKAARIVLDLAIAVFGHNSKEVAQAHDMLAVLSLLGRGNAAVDDAHEHANAAEQIYESLGLTTDADYMSHLRAVVGVHFHRRDTLAMVEASLQAVELSEKASSVEPSTKIQARALLSNAYEAHGDLAQAASEADRAADLARSFLPTLPRMAQQVEWLSSLACDLHSRSNPSVGLDRCTQLIKSLEASNRLESMVGQSALLGLCTAQGKTGRKSEALDSCLRAKRTLVAIEGEDSRPPAMGAVQRRLGTRYFALERYAEAAEAQRSVLELATEFRGADHPQVLEIRLELARSLMALAREDEVLSVLLGTQNISSLSEEHRVQWIELRRSAEKKLDATR
jgi:tetratricopeptide (TPR) repeat protein